MSALTPASFLQPGLFEAAPLSAWPFAPLQPQAYDLIMIDVPTRFENYSANGDGKSPQAHYRTMTIEEIAGLPVRDLARENCLLWAWATWPLLDVMVDIVKRSWGFRYVTGGAWNKVRWGNGYVTRSLCEPFLLAKLGEPLVDGRSFANLIVEPRREHSRKPEKAYAEAEKIMPHARRAEVFACTPRPGWEQCGDELGKFNGKGN